MDVYTLGSNPDETARLRRQSEELRPYAEELLAGGSSASMPTRCMPRWPTS
jgi:hypothetical protein